MKKDEFFTDMPTVHFRYVPDWGKFFLERSPDLKRDLAVLAFGGTLDSVADAKGKLVPLPHTVNIDTTNGRNAVQIYEQFKEHGVKVDHLGSLYPWVHDQREISIPWAEVTPHFSGRVASFDSGQEGPPHFAAETYLGYRMLAGLPVLIKSGGTDSLTRKVALDTIILGRYLTRENKKIIHIGSPESGYEKNSLALRIITGALYTALEDQLPGGVYVVTASRLENGEQLVQIHSGLGCVKLHSDGYFYSPNNGPVLSIYGGNIYKHAAYDKYIKNSHIIEQIPDFTRDYFATENTFENLVELLSKVAIESVENDPRVVDFLYSLGKRIFIIKARGSGNSSPRWKEAIEDVILKKDVTIIVITSADQGDVDLKKYAAGLDIEGVLSGRTLREEAANVLGAVLHDLKFKQGNKQEELQLLIEKYCLLFGML